MCREPRRGAAPQPPGAQRPAQPAAVRVLTFPLATALHLNLRLASARSRASCSSLAKVQCRFWLLLWYILQPETRSRGPGGKDPPQSHSGGREGEHLTPPQLKASGWLAGAGALTSPSRGNSVRTRASGAG